MHTPLHGPHCTTVSTFYNYADMGGRGHFGVLTSLLFKLLPLYHREQRATLYKYCVNEYMFQTARIMEACVPLRELETEIILIYPLNYCIVFVDVLKCRMGGVLRGTWKLNHRVNLCDPSTSYPTGTCGKLIHLSVTKQVKLPTNTGSGRSNQLLSLKWLPHLPLVSHICVNESRQHWLS